MKKMLLLERRFRFHVKIAFPLLHSMTICLRIFGYVNQVSAQTVVGKTVMKIPGARQQNPERWGSFKNFSSVIFMVNVFEKYQSGSQGATVQLDSSSMKFLVEFL